MGVTKTQVVKFIRKGDQGVGLSSVTKTQVVKFIRKGDQGVGLSSVTNYYAVSTSNSTAPTSGWTTTVPTITATNKYLWNYELLTFSDGSTYRTNARVIGVYGDQGDPGAAGKSIVSITEYYLTTSASSGVTRSTSGWTTTIQTITATNKYLWNYEKITYSYGNDTYTDPVIIGAYGNTGAPGPPGVKGSKGPALRGPQAWSDCAANYSFQAGGEDEDFIDVVLYNNNYYVCKRSHTKNSSLCPGSAASTNGGYWQLGDKVDLIATKIMLAAYALVDNLGVKAIEMYDSSNNPLFVVKDGNVTCKTGTFENVTVKGVLDSVTGSFKTLNCVNSSGTVVASLTFGSDGRMWVQSGDLYQQGTKDGRNLRFYTSGVWCRGVFGARERSVLVIYGSYGYYYPDGINGTSRYVSLTSGTDSNNKTYYKVPCYGQDGEYSGLPVDIVAFRITSSTNYHYDMQMSDSQRVLVANCNDDQNNVIIYTNGSTFTLSGGCSGEIVKLVVPQYPTTATNVLGRGIMRCGYTDNNW